VSPRDITLAAAVNDDAVLNQNLLASPLARAEGVELLLQRSFPSASRAYNDALDRATRDVIVFAHQDVYLPDGWERRLADAIDRLASAPWAVLGVFGVDEPGARRGRCWSTGLGRDLDMRVAQPTPAISLDELLIVVRKSSGVRFDERLPGFHFYGTDIALRARREGLGVFIIDAPVVHNSVPVTSLGGSYAVGYHAMRRLWAERLPLGTCVVPVTRFGVPFARTRLRYALRALRHGADRGTARDPDPASIARRLGYEAPADQPMSAPA